MASFDRVREAFSGSYAVEREVGQGGMATVYLARDAKHARSVALKVLRSELASAVGGDRFPREIQIVAQLAHPHILPLHDSGEIDGMLYYVMPFVEGESLRQKLTREKQLSLRETIKILREVADALAYAHERGIIHRDIKPDNVMLSGRHALVTDFGVAKAVTAAGADKLTTVGIALGTPAYMSPEQAMGETDLDARSDIYSLGAMAYEMLAGEPPFNRTTAQAVLSAHVLDAPPDIGAKRDDVPGELRNLITRCLAKEKSARYQSAEELLPILETALTPSGGLTPTATRPFKAVGKSGAEPAPTSRRAMIGGVAAAVLGAAGFGVWKTFAGPALPGPNRMAVLDIKDQSGADRKLADAMYQQLVVDLARVPEFVVAPSSAMETYRTAPKTNAEIGQELNVGAILEGQLFRANERRLRVTLQLSNARTTETIWSDKFDIDLNVDLFDAIDKVVPRITDGIRKAVTSNPTS